MIGESSLADGSDSKVLDPTSEFSTNCGKRVSDLRKRRHLVSQGLPIPCVGSRRSVQQPLRLQSLVGSRPAGAGAARPVLRLRRLAPRRPCRCGCTGTTDGPIGEFSASRRGADHPVLRDGWAIRERALQRPAGRVAVSYKFVWDPEKAETNQRKHDVSFHQASTVFADSLAMLMHARPFRR